MRYATSGEASIVFFDIVIDGEFASPDVSSVTYTIRNNAGSVMGGYDHVPVVTTAGQTSVSIAVNSTVNTKTLETETRTVILDFLVGGKPYQIKQSYVLVQYFPISANPKEVRTWLGVQDSDLPDDEIDLIAAFYEIVGDGSVITKADFIASLTAGGFEAMSANKALVYKASLSLIPSLAARFNQMEKSDAVQIQRYDNIDWDKLAKLTADKLADALNVISDDAEVTPTLLIINSPTDPVTGA